MAFNPIRVIFSDTMTGEDYWFDAPVYCSGHSVAQCIETLLSGEDDVDDAPIVPLAWIPDKHDSSICFIFQMGDDLIHGVVHRRFDPDHLLDPQYRRLA